MSMETHYLVFEDLKFWYYFRPPLSCMWKLLSENQRAFTMNWGCLKLTLELMNVQYVNVIGEPCYMWALPKSLIQFDPCRHQTMRPITNTTVVSYYSCFYIGFYANSVAKYFSIKIWISSQTVRVVSKLLRLCLFFLSNTFLIPVWYSWKFFELKIM